MIAFIETKFNHPDLHGVLSQTPGVTQRVQQILEALARADGFTFREVTPTGAKIYFDDEQKMISFLVNDREVFSGHLVSVEKEIDTAGEVLLTVIDGENITTRSVKCDYSVEDISVLRQ